jgi:hypothetical protein
MSAQIAQLKVELRYIKPEIWRRFLVDFSISLDELNDTIQDVMGWEHAHLYAFTFRGVEYSPPLDDDMDDFGGDFEDSTKAKLSKIGIEPKDKLKYLYDMGDSWEHIVKVEKIFEAAAGIKVPLCLEGARNCPPEDCGSFDGYEDIVSAMKNPKSKKAKEFIDWLGEPYDPEYFDIDKVNTILRPKAIKRK